MATQNTGNVVMRATRAHPWWPVIGTTIGALVGAVNFYLATPVYESVASMVVIPQRLPVEIVRPTITATPIERVNLISRQILTRTNLEGLIEDFSLYRQEQRRMAIGDVVERMRRDITIAVAPGNQGDRLVSFEVRYRSSTALMATRVTDRIVALFVELSGEDRSLRAYQTREFLGRQATRIQRRLRESQATLENWDTQSAGRPRPSELIAQHDGLLEGYRSILRHQEDAEMAVRMEQRHIGELFMMISGGWQPERPIGPAHLPFLVWGSLSGLTSSFLLMRLSSIWRRKKIASPA